MKFFIFNRQLLLALSIVTLSSFFTTAFADFRLTDRPQLPRDCSTNAQTGQKKCTCKHSNNGPTQLACLGWLKGEDACGTNSAGAVDAYCDWGKNKVVCTCN